MNTGIHMLRTGLGLAFLALFSSLLSAAPAETKEYAAGKDYEVINPPQPTSDPSKVEVLEFFWYGCPHCFHFEPDLNAWLKTKPDNVAFVRQPAVFNERWAAHAKMFYTAEALGVLDKLHPQFYEAIQVKKLALASEEEQAKFFADNGVAKDAFQKAYKSFAVDAKMRQAEGMGARYGISGTPTLVVNGKYRVSGSLAKSYPNMIAITNYLIAKESGKPAK
ncbi:thiol:disulfide interchange protein DsbA/DsbL [Methylococcus mesophilus]|uniref:thiol:disulfide interchange protein DsbA/DsbL n=1 Tax=Methylococcus mesophilus TaxID=2993564 RepID=UPI002938FE63|nr:thiol:disulfide interchange protein DsbA/DsbL [Methylococcus mesophilus]